ncbi:MAG: homoserine O-acetyltransferase [Pelagibacterales bacterium]|nr:homoserine O-acetyltransferase [Pelagibacterales bacterium]
MKVKSSFGPQFKEFEIGDIVFLAQDKPLKLVNGSEIKNFPIAYQTYGKLNENKSNAILICHALTGDQYVASSHPITNKKGWWDFLIGSKKAIDTDKFFVICSNIIGGCMGSFGPKEINSATNQPYGLDFPALTIHDMVNAQNLLIEHFGIKKLHAVVGGSTGGMQALSWSVLYPQKVNLVIPLATSYRHSPQNIAFHEVGRQAITADPNWNEGKYILHKTYPTKGLAVARMTAHITYLSEKALQKKFGRQLQSKENFSFDFKAEFQVESYLHHQGYSFVERFDANSYLYITKAVDYFDLEKDFGNKLSNAFADSAKNKDLKFCLISFSDDWLFPPSEAKKITMALVSCGIDVSSITIESNAGHDSFLIENEELKNSIAGFINKNYK